MKDSSTLPGWPMAMRREKAAAYLDMSPSTFDAAVKEGVIRPPVNLFRGLKAWHRADLDAFLEDRRTAAGDIANEWDEA